jgi:hypothetical protein
LKTPSVTTLNLYSYILDFQFLSRALARGMDGQSNATQGKGKVMAYGDKRDYPEIELFVRQGARWSYTATTTWSRTCKEAKARFLVWHGGLRDSDVKAAFKR